MEIFSTAPQVLFQKLPGLNFISLKNTPANGAKLEELLDMDLLAYFGKQYQKRIGLKMKNILLQLKISGSNLLVTCAKN